MELEQCDSDDRNLAGDVANPENTKVANLDAFFGRFGNENPPLEMLKRVVQDNVIQSFKSTSMKDIYEKWGKGI